VCLLCGTDWSSHAMQVYFGLPKVKVQNILNVPERRQVTRCCPQQNTHHPPHNQTALSLCSGWTKQISACKKERLVCGNAIRCSYRLTGSVLPRSYSVRTVTLDYKLHVNRQQPTVVNIQLSIHNSNSHKKTLGFFTAGAVW
jgi:hypothetical protein